MQSSERGRYRSREPRGLRDGLGGARVRCSAPQTGGRARQDVGQELVAAVGGGVAAAEREGRRPLSSFLKPRHLGHTRGPPNFTVFCSIGALTEK